MKLHSSAVFNLIFHNLIWLLCVIGRDRLIWLSLPLVVIYSLILLHNENVSLRALAIPFFTGLAVDGTLSWINVFEFESGSWLLPLWLMVLWLSFAGTFSMSLGFLGKDWRMAAAAGAIAMPLNYTVGQSLGAVEFEVNSLIVWSVLGLVWGILFPIILGKSKISEPHPASH